MNDLEEHALVPAKPFVENLILFAFFHYHLVPLPLVTGTHGFLTSSLRKFGALEQDASVCESQHFRWLVARVLL